MVTTVRGEIPVDGMGVTLMHEHLFVLDAEVRTLLGKSKSDAGGAKKAPPPPEEAPIDDEEEEAPVPPKTPSAP